MLAEFKIINDPLRPSISTNLCAVCWRNSKDHKLGCCSYEPEFCLFDLVFLYLHYPELYLDILKRGQIIAGFNGIMVEMKAGLNRCPFAGDSGCLLPKDATPPLCRLYICREAAMFGPEFIEEKFEEYFSSKEYAFNKDLNRQLKFEGDLTSLTLHKFIAGVSPGLEVLLKKINRVDSHLDFFKKEMELEAFGGHKI